MQAAGSLLRIETEGTQLIKRTWMINMCIPKMKKMNGDQKQKESVEGKNVNFC